MHMMKKQLKIRKKQVGNIFMGMYLGSQSTSQCLQLLLDLVPSYLHCEYLLNVYPPTQNPKKSSSLTVIRAHPAIQSSVPPLVLPLSSFPSPSPEKWKKTKKGKIMADVTFIFHVICSTVFIFLLAIVGVFYPYNRGALFTALVVIYALTSGIAGYVATSFYCQLEGRNWVCAAVVL